MSYTYANRLRTSLSVATPNASPWTQSYGYDPLDHLTNVTSPAGSFTYILGGTSSASPLIKELLLPGGAYITNTFDGNARLTETALQNSAGLNLDAESYTYNQGNQRTQQVFAAGNFMNYTYDNIGELKTALGKEPGGVTNRWQEQFGYTYDPAGNLSGRTNNTLIQTYAVNNLNELGAINRSGKMTVEGTTTSLATNVTVNGSNAVLYVDSTFASTNQSMGPGAPTTFTAIAQDSHGRVNSNTVTALWPGVANMDYDLNGNLLRERSAAGLTNNFAYDGENQLIAVWVTNTWKSEFTYDGKMRRRIRKEFTWNGTAWSATNEVHYVYDGNLVIEERDANNLPQVTYTRGTDFSRKLEVAGGIGGMLARTSNSKLLVSDPFATAFYHSDGSGNVTALIYSNQTIAAKYEYDPYGNILDQIGVLADANLYRFSTKEYHAASGLNYYLYRYYEPNLQRWLTADPISDVGFEIEHHLLSKKLKLQKSFRKFILGSQNPYDFVKNEPNGMIDSFGLIEIQAPPDLNPDDPDMCDKLAKWMKQVEEMANDPNNALNAFANGLLNQLNEIWDDWCDDEPPDEPEPPKPIPVFPKPEPFLCPVNAAPLFIIEPIPPQVPVQPKPTPPKKPFKFPIIIS